MTSNQNVISIITEAIQDKKGRGITIINLSKIDTAATGAFVVCEGRNPSQVAAIADNVREFMQKSFGRKPINYDGYRNSQWIIVDYGEVMIHVFLPEPRGYYNLEQLWGDGEITRIPDLD